MDNCAAASSSKNSTHDNNRQQDENTTLAALDELAQTEAKLKETVEVRQEMKRQWRERETALHCSNWKLELELKKLRAVTDDLDQELLARTDESNKAHDDLEVFKQQYKQEAGDFWTFFQEESQKYSNLFTNAHIEYSSDCLNQDINEYRRESDFVRSKIAHVEEEMEAAKIRYGLVELDTNEEAKLLVDLDAVKKTLADKRDIRRATEAAEETINVLKLKIKQKQHEIAYLKNK